MAGVSFSAINEDRIKAKDIDSQSDLETKGRANRTGGENDRYGNDIDNRNLNALDDAWPIPGHWPDVQVGIEEEDQQAHEITGVHQ